MLTPRTAEVLDAIKAHMRTNGYAPTLADICKALKMRSPSTAYYHVAQLEAIGYIDRAGPRAWRVNGPDGAACPHCGAAS
jgi:repressor LexA